MIEYFLSKVEWIISTILRNKAGKKEKIDHIQDLVSDLENNYNKLRNPEDRPNYKLRRLDLQRKFLDYFSFDALKNINDEIETLHEDIDRLLIVIQPKGDIENTQLLQKQIIYERERLKDLTGWILKVLFDKYKIPIKIH